MATPPLFRNPARAPRGNSVLSPFWPHHGFQRERSEFQSRSQQGQSRALPATGQASRSIVPRGDLKAALLCRHPRREASGRARLRGTMASKHRTVQGLTPQSSGAPTAGPQGPACGTWCIITARALASYRCRPLTSNVRPRMPTRNASPALSGNAPCAPRGTGVFSACKQHRGLQEQRSATRNSVHRVQSHTAPRIPLPQCAVVRSEHEALLHWQPWLSGALPHQPCFGWALTRPSGARPNPLLKRSANGMPPAPGRRYTVHFRHPGAGGIPLSPA